MKETELKIDLEIINGITLDFTDKVINITYKDKDGTILKQDEFCLPDIKSKLVLNSETYSNWLNHVIVNYIKRTTK